MAVAKVIIDLALDRTFDYEIPDELAGVIRVGVMVDVPFGRSRRTGFVLSIVEESDYSGGVLKQIAGLAAGRAGIPEHLVELGLWMADYYCCSQEQAIRTLLPAAVRNGKIRKKTRKIYRIDDRAAAESFLSCNGAKPQAALRVDLVKALLTHGALPVEKLRELLPAFSQSALQTLIRHKIVSADTETVRRDVFGERQVLPSRPLPPTPDQQAALKTISRMLRHETESHVLLLHGVTNSGKTEVYLQAIAETIAMGRSAIVLVPEISLTPQTVRRFRARFGDRLSVLHSRLSDGERFDEWNRINDGEVSIAVGARSALFAPFRNLGLIIVDEEHESSYKQSEAPRYSARDVAVMRGKFEDAAVILGSATPSAESCYNAATGKFLLARMKTQVDDKLAPHIRLFDQRMQGPPEKGKSTFFSPLLIEAVFDRIRRGEQSILFLNRRGYARVMLCEQCGFEARCPDCSVAYTYSKRHETLTCHLCGSVIPAYESCPECGSPEIRYAGIGTEKIEAAAAAIFHPARIARMDSDTMRSAEDYETVLERFRRGELDILVGTQMIAKGLHFPNVTLVGLINADLGLTMPDFRAQERTFQLITQVAGRAGRGDIRGEVIIQSRNPENDTIRFAVEQDFEGFSKFDLEFRELLDYPPFTHLIAVHFRGEDEAATASFADRFTEELRRCAHDEIKFAGPAPAPIERIKTKYRYMLLIRGRRLAVLRRRLRQLVLHWEPPRGVEVYADVDAQSLL